MTNKVSFYLNGKLVNIKNPAPDLLLIDYLHSPEVGLIGPKKSCGQGGCGACTVLLSHWDEVQNQPVHRAINSCLRPVCALGGLVVTTIEGTGAARPQNPEFLHHSTASSRSAAPLGAPMSPALIEAAKQALEKRNQVKEAVANRSQNACRVDLVDEVAEHPSEHSHKGMNPIAHRLALNNGSQCGYCSVGFVMNMSEFITNNPNATKKEIEDCFDGNICRCTGYRPILTGMKTFASDWTEEDEMERMKCLADDGCSAQLPAADVAIPFPPSAKGPAQPVSSAAERQVWLTPTTLHDLAQILHKSDCKTLRLVSGNTSFGVYPNEYPQTKVFVDIRLIPELNVACKLEGDALRVSAGTSYTDLLAILAEQRRAVNQADGSCLEAVDFMARRTGGRIVRNAASLGGNTMLVLKHIGMGTGGIFPSDLFTVLVAINAKIEYLELNEHGHFHAHDATATELSNRVKKHQDLADKIVLTAYLLPFGDSADVVLAQKVALRETNSHSIVNSTTVLTFSHQLMVQHATLVFGGIAPYPWHAKQTEALMTGREIGLEHIAELSTVLAREVDEEIERWKLRMADVPSEGFTKEYLIQLAVAFLYKAIVNAMLHQGAAVPENVVSSGIVTWGKWPVSNGLQFYESQNYKKPVAQPYIKTTAMFQTSGQIRYTQQLPVPPQAVNGAFVQSTQPLANYRFILPGNNEAVSARQLRDHLSGYAETFIDLITDENIKNGGINLQGMGLDQPLFAIELVSYVGQSIALVLAVNEQEAIRIAEYVTSDCVAYSPVSAADGWPAPWNEPVLNLEKAIEMGSVFPDTPASSPYVTHIWKITRPGSQFDWTRDKQPLDREIVVRDNNIDGVPCTVVESTQLNGAQIHFYMETQACIAEPQDQGRFTIHPSTQSPMEMHQTTAMALGIQYNQIDIQVTWVGGGFGGKTEQARFVTGPTAVAAKAIKKAVRLAVPRAQDSSMIGKRHAYYGQYQIAVDRGDVNPQDKGIIRGMQTKMWGDGGAFYDCSFIVSNCIQLRADNAYKVANFENQIDVCRTNTAPSTAFRSFGDIQGKNIIENEIDDAAFSIGMLPEDLREKNLYQRGDVTPFGQALSYCYMREVWRFMKEKSKYTEKREQVDSFNRNNKWRKQGLALIPVKYGSGYNWLQLEQAAAIVVVNQADGSVVVHQGGVEMGQGLATQVLQVASYVLNVPMEMINVNNPKTSITPNPTSTGGSTGTPYNCEAVKQTCQDLRARLLEFGYQMREEYGDDYCKGLNIDFWNYPEQGWATPLAINGKTTLIWQNLIQAAYSKRVSLIANFTAKIRGGETPIPCMTYKPQDLQPNIPGVARDEDAIVAGGVDSFIDFTYSAACAVVELDVLTGEVKVLSADIVYDMGWSMNPAIDIGQVEGAFVQGIGYFLTEKLVYEEDGEHKGTLNTTNTWGYKIPNTVNIPLEMNTHLFPRNDPSVVTIPENPNDIFSAKEVGEPPMVLANSVFFALKAAIRASRIERGLSGLFRLDAPATVQETRRALEVSIDDLKES
ncbi:MAG: molybdopterin cofactor-binding domain-containing protein [Gammaproteobacteria bacterium]